MNNHTDDKNRLLIKGARYFLFGAALILAGIGVFMAAYHYQPASLAPPVSQNIPQAVVEEVPEPQEPQKVVTNRPRTVLTVDNRVRLEFYDKFGTILQPEEYRVFPAFTYLDPEGNEQTFEVKKGEFVLLNIWGTWCPPCIVELPDMEKLQELLPPDTSLRILPVSVDKQMTHADLMLFLKKRGIWAGAGNHDNKGIIVPNSDIRGLPTSFLLAEGGEILYIFEGQAPWSNRESVAFFKSLPPRS